MKRAISLLTSLAMVFIFCFTTLAAVEETASRVQASIEYLNDGSYIETTITEEKTSYSARATTTINGSKKITHKSSNGEVLWTATLKGTFTYTGSSSACTASSITYSVVNDNWKITSATASKSGNKATGDITAKHYLLGMPIKTVEKTVTLTCNSSGMLS